VLRLLSFSCSTEFKEMSDILRADRVARGELPSDADSTAVESAVDEEEDAPSSSPPAAASFAAAAVAAVPLRPIVDPTATPLPSQRRLLEIGCGVGNALFPLLRLHPDVFFYGVDCSRNAIQVVQNHADYSSRCAAWVIDLVGDELPLPLRHDHLDFATLIFVLSAIHPDKMLGVLKKVHHAMKKDEGVLFVRD
jgi:SAM-dependent methyltransferase